MANSAVFRTLCVYLALWPSVYGWIHIISELPAGGTTVYLLGYSASLLAAIGLMVGLISRDRSQPVSIEFGRWRWYALGCFLVAAALGPWLSAPEPAYAYLRLILMLPLIMSGIAAYLWFQTLPEKNYVQVVLAFIIGMLLHAVVVLPFLQPSIDLLDLGWTSGILPFFNIRRYTNYFAIGIPALTGILIWLRSAQEMTHPQNRLRTGLAWVGLCLLWTMLFWTGSRAPTLAILCSFVSVIIIAPFYIKPILSISLSSAFVGSVLSLFLPRPTSMFGFWSRLLDPTYYESANRLGSSRIALWSETWRLFLESPILGNGHGQLLAQESVPEYLRAQTPHNFPLEMLNDFGIVGGIAMIALVYGGIAKLVLKARQQNLPPLTLVCLLGLLTMTFQSFFDGNITSFQSCIPFVLFWALTAASLRRSETFNRDRHV